MTKEPATKEVVLAGPGSGKTTYLAAKAVGQNTLSIDPVGTLRRMVAGHIDVMVYDKHGPAEFNVAKRAMSDHFTKRRPLLIDVSELTQKQQTQFADDLGSWLRQNFRDGHLVLDEIRWLIPNATGIEHGMLEFIAKCRNYGVGVTITGHRPASISKDVVGLCDTFRIGRMMHPLDLEAATRMLKSQTSSRDLDDLSRKLPSLEPGYWYVLKGAAPG